MRIPTLAAALSLALSSSFAIGCGGSTPEPATPPPAAAPGAPAASTAPAADVAVPAVWSNDFTKEQAVAFMKKNVVGPMGKVFTGPQYASYSCKTCHGPDFKDPKDYLPHLTLKDGKMTAFADKPEIAKFMASSVTPAMAQAMGEKPWDPQTHTGFGCNGCHTVDMK